jgi:hypothetical protein
VILAGFLVRPKPGCPTSICRGIDSSVLCTRRRLRRCARGRRESVDVGGTPRSDEW